MSKTPDPVDGVLDKVVPAAEELVAAIAERVAPYAHQAAEVAHQAADKVAPYAHQAADVAHQAADKVAPYAQQAADAVSPYAHQAADAVAPYAHQAAETVAPYAALAAQQGRKASHEVAERLTPAYESARDAVLGAKDKVTSDVLPAATAAAAPLVASAAERGRAVVETVKKQPVPVVAPPRKKRRWLTTFAVVAAAAGATYVVVRKLVGDKGSQWQTARPSTPYVPPTSAEAAAKATTETDADADTQTPPSAHDLYRAADGAAEPDQPAEGGDVVESTTSLYGTVGSQEEASARDAGDPGASVDSDTGAVADRVTEIDEVADVDEGEPAGSTAGPGLEGGSGAYPDGARQEADQIDDAVEQVAEEPEDAVTIEQDEASGIGPDAHPDRYDIPGAYVGVEPPEGYTIKGNERSMKYHLPESNSYARTIAEVWFDSEEAAQQAGYSRAHG